MKWSRINFQPNLPMGKDGRRVTASKEHIALSREAAKEGMVLLKNNGGLLPFGFGTRLALFGKGTFDYVKGGGGSGDVTVSYVVNLYQGLKKLGSNRCSWYFTATWRRLGFRWIVGDDGHISVVGADRVGGVRPVVYLDISKVAIASGAGEREDPYILQAVP